MKKTEFTSKELGSKSEADLQKVLAELQKTQRENFLAADKTDASKLKKNIARVKTALSLMAKKSK